MSLRKLFFAGVALGACLVALRATAEDATLELSVAPVPATNKPAFQASVRPGETVGAHQVERAFLNVGTNQIVFRVPTGFQLDASDPQKIVLTEPTTGCFITVRVGNRLDTDSGSETTGFRTTALTRFPGARITSEAMDLVANHSGPAFNLEWLTGNGTAQSARVEFIPMAAGVLEFSVMSPSSGFKSARLYLAILLGSLQTNENGKLVITPLPDYS